MKVIQKINNNVALCIDGNGKELIAFGKGIGFPKTPYILDDLTKINRTFYQVKKEHLQLFRDIDEDVMNICTDIMDYARIHINKTIDDSLYFLLVDHLNFTIERARKNIYIPMKFTNDIQFIYEEEVKVGKWAIERIQKQFKVKLHKNEAIIIALHIAECEENGSDLNHDLEEKLIDEIAKIVEQDMDININKDGFNYSRFVTHVQFMLNRQNQSDSISSENLQMYQDMVEKFPKISICVDHIKECIFDKLKKDIDEEEKLYLMLHVNRLCSREDCYR
ncbi:MAG: PRD domain-containing protein [Holdemanella sp.]|nr:PRD domain-containing protein [Holdemanella sp.]